MVKSDLKQVTGTGTGKSPENFPLIFTRSSNVCAVIIIGYNVSRLSRGSRFGEV